MSDDSTRMPHAGKYLRDRFTDMSSSQEAAVSRGLAQVAREDREKVAGLWGDLKSGFGDLQRNVGKKGLVGGVGKSLSEGFSSLGRRASKAMSGKPAIKPSGRSVKDSMAAGPPKKPAGNPLQQSGKSMQAAGASYKPSSASASGLSTPTAKPKKPKKTF